MVRRMRIRGSVALALGALAAACGNTTVEKYPTSDSMCTDVATAECGAVAPRCVIATSQCQAVRMTDCQMLAATAVAAGRTYTPSLAQACVDATNSLYENTTLDPASMQMQTDACNRVFAGAKLELQSCTSDYDCTGTLVCDRGDCATVVMKNQGDPCGDPGDTCAEGSYCGTNGMVLQCIAAAQMGEPCSATVLCDSNLYCAIPATAMTGTCAATLGLGMNCTSSDQCNSSAPYCDPDVQDGPKCDDGASFASGSASCKAYGGS